MSAFISTFEKGSMEYDKLRIASVMLTDRSPNNNTYLVNDTYFDFGQDWMWTTIICYNHRTSSYQALTPREQEEIIMADTYDEMLGVIEKYFRNPNRLDKIEE